MTPSTLITVAPTGAEARKDEVPALPVTLADTLSFARGRPVAGNAELVERAAVLAAHAQRPPMWPQHARELPGVRDHC